MKVKTDLLLIQPGTHQLNVLQQVNFVKKEWTVKNKLIHEHLLSHD